RSHLAARANGAQRIGSRELAPTHRTRSLTSRGLARSRRHIRCPLSTPPRRGISSFPGTEMTGSAIGTSPPAHPHPPREQNYSPLLHDCGSRGQPRSVQVANGTGGLDRSLRAAGGSLMDCARSAALLGFLSFVRAHRLLQERPSIHTVHRVIHNWGELASDLLCHSSERQERPTGRAASRRP